MASEKDVHFMLKGDTPSMLYAEIERLKADAATMRGLLKEADTLVNELLDNWGKPPSEIKAQSAHLMEWFKAYSVFLAAHPTEA